MGKWLENWYCWFLIRWKEGNSYFLYVPIFLVGKILFWKEALEGKSMGKWLENWLRLVVSLGVAIIFWMAKIDVLPGPTQTWDEFQVFLGNFAFGPKVCATSHAPAGARGLRRALSGNHLWYHGMDDFRKFHVGNCMELYIYILYIIYIYIYIFSIIYIYVYYILCYLYIYIHDHFYREESGKIWMNTRMRSAWLGCATWFLWMPRPLPCSRSWRMSMKMRPGCSWKAILKTG